LISHLVAEYIFNDFAEAIELTPKLVRILGERQEGMSIGGKVRLNRCAPFHAIPIRRSTKKEIDYTESYYLSFKIFIGMLFSSAVLSLCLRPPTK